MKNKILSKPQPARWLIAHSSEFQNIEVTVLGDDLYSRQPMCELASEQGFNFIFTCLPKSHPTLYSNSI